MKLIACTKCKDVVAIRQDFQRSCMCGESSGQYASDGLNVKVWGPCYVLGISNTSFAHATIRHTVRPTEAMGWTFDAFIIPEDAESVKRIS